MRQIFFNKRGSTYSSFLSKKFIFILMVLYSLANLGCKKFLEESSQSDFTPKTTASYSELLFGTAYPRTKNNLEQAVCLMSDDVQIYAPIVGQSYQVGEKALPAFSWQPDYFQGLQNSNFDNSGFKLDGYKNYYSLIMGANVVLQYTDASIGTQNEKDYLMGQAYALRAFYYFQLVNLYGRPYNDSTTTPEKSLGVPLILSADISETQPARNTVKEVYNQIRKDLDSASNRLDKEKRTGNIYRIDYIAAHFLAARVNLFVENWDAVIANADYVIQQHPQLMDLPNNWINTGWYVGKLPFLPIIGEGNAETIWTFGNINEVYSFGVSETCNISQDLMQQFNLKDLRTKIYLEIVPPFLSKWVAAPFTVQKWSDLIKASNGNFTCQAFRSAEAYLNRAEAYAQKYRLTGDNSFAHKALNDLNTLRTKRFMSTDFQPLLSMPADSLLQFCRNERRREFFMEGHRWFDLRRYGMPSIAHFYAPAIGVTYKYILKAHDQQYTLSLPPTAMMLNNNLVQNPIGPIRNPIN